MRRFCMLLMLAAGCSSESAELPDAAPQDQADPQVSFENLRMYQAVTGTTVVELAVSDDIGVAQVELFAVGDETPLATATAEPFSLEWDTASMTDGLHGVFARATDTAGKTAETDPLDVIVLVAGQAVELDEGEAGEMFIPESYTPDMDVDVVHHWTLAEGFRSILAVAEWSPAAGQQPWELELTVGTGFCPHSGVALAGTGDYQDTGPMLTEVPDDGELAAGMYFVHIKPVNAADHLGETVVYGLRAYVFP